jgi:phosphoglycolate phosphatase-like HAD superfamily hydrolase
MQHLIFDFDGVIGNTYNAWEEAQKQLLIKAGDLTEPFVDLNTHAIRRPVYARNHTLTDYEMLLLSNKLIAGGKKVYELGFELFDDFVNAIKKIDNCKIAIVSSGSQIYVLPALAKSGLKLSHILAYEDHHSKEEKIEIVCRDWGINVDDVYYFTDTLADVFELQNMINPNKLIGVSWGYCTTEQLLTELAPENILKSPTDLPILLAR